MHEFSDTAALESALETLSTREDGPFVMRLAREPGKRESRYMHLFCGEPDAAALVAHDENTGADTDALTARVETLEREVAELRERLESLLGHLGE
ncbi:Protein of unknown function YceH [Cronobacter turicensis 564]|nr:Protein of unknown function YceH [Cronobacter turicensis 564]